jgi:Icc-related predicted phosphoesterase
MKVLYTSDLHGEISLYQEFLALTRSFNAEWVALGGDLLPSFSPSRKYEDMIPNQKSFICEFLLPFFEKMIGTKSVRRIFVIPGNWDLGYPYLFERPIEGLIDLCQKTHHLQDGYEIIGYPFVPPTPFRPKDFEKMDDPESPWPPQKNPSYARSPDQADQLIPIDPHLYLKRHGTIQEDLDEFPGPGDPQKTIFVMHSPPFGTKLDQIEGGAFTGSRSIRKFVERTQPLLTLHGHIHEAPEISGSCVDRIGKTLCVNPGQFTGGRKGLHAATFEIESVEGSLRHTLFPQNRS